MDHYIIHIIYNANGLTNDMFQSLPVIIRIYFSVFIFYFLNFFNKKNVISGVLACWLAASYNMTRNGCQEPLTKNII